MVGMVQLSINSQIGPNATKCIAAQKCTCWIFNGTFTLECVLLLDDDNYLLEFYQITIISKDIRPILYGALGRCITFKILVAFKLLASTEYGLQRVFVY